MKILPVIMCGGTGTRVWPESRESRPKQFISLVGPHSTFQMATEMLADGVFETPIVISNHDYRFLVAEQLQKIKREARPTPWLTKQSEANRSPRIPGRWGVFSVPIVGRALNPPRIRELPEPNRAYGRPMHQQKEARNDVRALVRWPESG